MRVDLAAPLPEKLVSIMRYFEFAETILNLQEVEGFETCLNELSYGKVESACGELDIARMLAFHELRFRFVAPQKKKKGEDYDFEIFYPDGFKVAADATTKFEANPVRVQSIRNTLDQKRPQLPKDQPGIIFVKVPEKWIADRATAASLATTAEEFLRGTDRVKSVKFFAAPTIFAGDQTIRSYMYREVSNAKFPERDWEMFRDFPAPLPGAPPWWIKIAPELLIPELLPPWSKTENNT